MFFFFFLSACVCIFHYTVSWKTRLFIYPVLKLPEHNLVRFFIFKIFVDWISWEFNLLWFPGATWKCLLRGSYLQLNKLCWKDLLLCAAEVTVIMVIT